MRKDNDSYVARMVKWTRGRLPGRLLSLLDRPMFSAEADRTAEKVLADVRVNGDEAVAKYVRRFDGVSLKPSRFRVARTEIADSRRRVDPDFKAAAREAMRRIAAFSKAGKKKAWSIPTPRGGAVGERFVPCERVGVYVPGGAAPLVSTALMTVTLARVAGVPEIVACTPCDKRGKVNPYLLYALDEAGATEIYRVGGAQAIAMMAFGTGTVKKTQKIVGPGNAFVTAAKRRVYGYVDLDLVAGPSEIAVLADDSASSSCVAADLLSQAEHGSGSEISLLVTTSEALARSVQREIKSQLKRLPRRNIVEAAMKKGMLLVVVNNLRQGVELCNRFAPEHLELMVRNPKRWFKRVRCAGAVFLGPWSPEAAGDFAAGPSHVLPTGGAAARFSGLTVDDFVRRTSYIGLTKADLREMLPVIETFSRVEGLDAHARSAQARFRR